MTTPSWLAFAVLIVMGLAASVWVWRERAARHRKAQRDLPTDWALSARPVFSTGERRIHRLLREALPQHVILSKLPLVRFCQPLDPGDVRYWYDLLEGVHVTFAVCSANGRVLAAIDLESRRSQSRRAARIKQAALAACGVSHVHYQLDRPPSIADLQALVPAGGAPARPSARMGGGTDPLNVARDTLASTVANRRAERTLLWKDSAAFQDSFFAPDSRFDHLGSDFATLTPTHSGRGPEWPDATLHSEFAALSALSGDNEERHDDVAGTVVDAPSPPSRARG